MSEIYTIGYEGKTVDEFIKLMKKNEINILIDVRENANSRKKGFSKKSLSETLIDNGINYKHCPELGTPKELRNQYQNDGDLENLFNQYRRYLEENPQYIENLLCEVGNDLACLMCLEKTATQCHRYVISEYLFLNCGAAINHL